MGINERLMVKKAMEDLVLEAKKNKEYTKDSVMNIITICCSKQMHEKGYTSEQALSIATNLIKNEPSKANVYSKLLLMSGVE